MFWDNKRYHSFDFYCKKRFGKKVIRIPLNSGATCPNRDGAKGTGGCAFCSEKGSGDFTMTGDNIKLQFDEYICYIKDKWIPEATMPYLQSFTNTYGDISHLIGLYDLAARLPMAVAVSIATRPDCVSDEICSVLNDLNRRLPVFVELGLQSSSDITKQRMNCLHTSKEYSSACEKLNTIGINIVTHAIYGLPGENSDDFKNTVRFAVENGSSGLKLQLLHVLKNSSLHEMYLNDAFTLVDFDDYIRVICETVSLLPKDIVIHRLTGDGDKNTLIGPLWSRDKRKVLSAIDKTLAREGLYQGCNQAILRRV